MDTPHRPHCLSHWAAWLQRVSGLLLALFLPFHFLVLGLALNDPAALDGFLDWTEMPLVKVAEAGLVGLLALHFVGGMRVLMIEFLPWRSWEKDLVAATGGAALFFAGTFLLNAF